MERITQSAGMGKDAFREQSLYRHPLLCCVPTELKFTDHEIAVLRRLAEQVAEIAERPEMKAKSMLWRAHNDLKTDTPLIFVDPENGWNEIFTEETFECRDVLAKSWENILKKDIYSANMIKDDRVITKNFDIPYYYTDDGFGIDQVVEYTDSEAGAYHISAAIEDYEEDFEKLHFPNLIIDKEKTEAVYNYAKEIFGGILNVRMSMKWHWDDTFTERYVALRGMEDFMCDFVTDREWVSRMFKFMADGIIDRFEKLEKQGMLFLNNDETYLGTGGMGYTDDLPASDFTGHVRTKDMWVTLQAQETVSIDPDDFGELVLPEFIRIAERFGLAHYGCCEGYDPRWKYVKQIPNLRHVSVSPWADASTVPEYLGKKYVASVKLKPTPLSFPVMNEEEVRRDCRKAVEDTYGGICEFLMKDNHTIGNNPNNLIRWTQIMREEIERKY